VHEVAELAFNFTTTNTAPFTTTATIRTPGCYNSSCYPLFAVTYPKKNFFKYL
jgi:hypothetical protein